MVFRLLSLYDLVVTTLASNNILRFSIFKGCCPGSVWSSTSQRCESKETPFILNKTRCKKYFKNVQFIKQYLLLLLKLINCSESLRNKCSNSYNLIKNNEINN